MIFDTIIVNIVVNLIPQRIEILINSVQWNLILIMINHLKSLILKIKINLNIKK